MACGCQAGVIPAKLTTDECENKSSPTEACKSIKLGIDAHAKWYYVGRKIDSAKPQPVQKMTFEGLLRFLRQAEAIGGRSAHLPRSRAFWK